MYKAEPKFSRGVGDHPYAFGHRANAHFFHSASEAQALADRICSDLHLDSWKVRFTHRNTSRLMGKAWPTHRLIELNRSGECVGTLLHEMAHDRLGWHHGVFFKDRQLSLLRWYDEHLPTDPPTHGTPAPEPRPDSANESDLIEIFESVREQVLASTGLKIYLEADGVVRAHNSYELLERAKALGSARHFFESWGVTVTTAAGRLTVEI